MPTKSETISPPSSRMTASNDSATLIIKMHHLLRAIPSVSATCGKSLPFSLALFRGD
jgi:hypothetical protein